MTDKDTPPTWFQAAFVVLARDLAQVSARLDELEATMSLRHTKMDMLLGHLIASELQDSTPAKKRPRPRKAAPVD
jgi:hypothetical protein